MLYIAVSKSISLFEISMATINIRHKLATVFVILRRRRRGRHVERSLLGAYNSTLLLARENDHFTFFKYTRMSQERFHHLLSLIRPKIEKEYKVCPPMSAEGWLAATLRYLASNDSKQSISYPYKIWKSTINGIIDEVCDVIWEWLADFVKTPTTPQDWENIIKDFDEI